MTKEDLIKRGLSIFNFNPDQEVDSISQILEVAYKKFPRDFYFQGAGIYAEYLARYIDEEEK